MRGLAIIFRFFMLLVLLLPVVALCPVKAETTSEGPILIVTSYNPETRSISDNLSAFMDEYRQRGGKYTPIIESMNCKNLSEAYLWKSRMASILGKYKGKNRPSLVILLGQEAWSAYISQDTEIAKKTPSICGMVSVNGLVLPANSPNVVFADEPTGALNSDNSKAVLDILSKLYKEGQSIIMVTLSLIHI